MCITQAEILCQEYEEAKQNKKTWRTRKQKQKRMERTLIIMLIHN